MSTGGALSTVNITAELTRLGLQFEATGDKEVKCACPAHDDESPSCSMNATTGLWKCHSAGCGASGDFVSFLARKVGASRQDIIADLSTRYVIDDVKTVDATLIEKHHRDIWDDGELLSELRIRGITDDMIRKARIGKRRDRITIPVLDAAGRAVNLRLYAPGESGKNKFKNLRGYGKQRLYVPGGSSALEQADRVVILGGELKALLVDSMLKPYKVPGVSSSGGEGNWHPRFTKEIEDKHVVIMYDIDVSGHKGAHALAAQIAARVRSVRIAELPLDIEKYPHGDVSDWVGREHATVEDLLHVLDTAEEWVPPAEAEELHQDAIETTLNESVHPRLIGRPVRIQATVTAIDTTPFLVPRTVKAACEKDQQFCVECPVYTRPQDQSGLTQLTIKSRSPGILQSMGSSQDGLRSAIMSSLKMPPCKAVKLTVADNYVVHDVRLSPTLEQESSAEHVMRPAAVVVQSLESNATYEFEGVVIPHPKTQQAVLLADSAVMTDSSLDEFSLSSEEFDELHGTFSCEHEEDAITAKLDSIYEDLESNVTRIFQRRDLHIVMDLVWHSPLHFEFDGRVEKGWAEAVVVGDSAQGKSETALRLMQHYRLGQRVECKNASVAGLIGGLQKIDGRYFVVWGKAPQCDRQLLILEEVKGASPEVLARMTDMRSSGIAELPKIEKRRTNARTRMIWISNPRSERPVSAYNFGIESIKELIGAMEDVRRFDIALIVASGQVDAAEINARTANRDRVEHTYDSDLCKKLVLWAWTRKAKDVVLTDAARAEVLRSANWLCEHYSDAMPLVDRGSMRLKLARLSAALAARVMSCDQDGKQIVIRPAHVRWITSFIDRLYSDDVCGYKDFSKAMNVAERLDDPEKIMRRIGADVPYPSDFVDKMLHTDRISLIDICDWCGWDRGDAQKLLAFLVRKNALVRIDREYRKTPGFISALKRASADGSIKKLDRPFDSDDEDEFAGL